LPAEQEMRRRRAMDSREHDDPAGPGRTLVRVLVLLSALAIAVLLTRCPLAGTPDGPVPSPPAQTP
jgi:hypothetical protein